MALILGIIIGILIGAGIAYMLLNQSLSRQQQEIRQQKRLISDLEQQHETRMRQAIESLKQEYQKKLDQKTEELARRRDTRIQNVTVIPKETVNPLEPVTPAQEPPTAPELAPPTATAPGIAAAQPLSPPVSAPPPVVEPIEPPSPQSVVDSSPIQPPPSASLSAPQAASQPVGLNLVRFEMSPEQRQALTDDVLRMGASGQTRYIPDLRYLALSPAFEVREAVAIALGRMLQAQPSGTLVSQVVPILGKLSQDPVSAVRFAAVSSLNHTTSVKALPFLKRSLRDSNMDVTRVAAAAMAQFKRYQRPQGTVTGAKRKVKPRNSSQASAQN